MSHRAPACHLPAGNAGTDRRAIELTMALANTSVINYLAIFISLEGTTF